MEEQVIKALDIHGYKINNNEELYAFLDTEEKCQFESKGNIKTLIVDGKEICEWDYNINMGSVTTPQGEIKITATAKGFYIL